MTVTVAALILAVLPGQTRTSTRSRPAKAVELCTVMRKPAKYIGHRISLQADVLADGMHGSVLVSPQCKRGIVPDFTNSLSSGDEYENAIFAGGRGTLNKDIRATFTGILRHEPYSGMFRHGHLIYVLRVDSMDGLIITYKPGQDPSPPKGIPLHMPTAPPNVSLDHDIPHE